MSLRGVQVGDEVMVQDTLRGAQRYRVVAQETNAVILTKLLGGPVTKPERFDRETGRWDHKTMGHQRTAYTWPEWRRLGYVGSLMGTLREFLDAATQPHGIDGLSDAEVQSTDTLLRGLLAKRKGVIS